jgi:hypothetical protein
MKEKVNTAGPVEALLTLPPVLSGTDVAAMLGYRSAAGFYTRRLALEAEGFPRKLPGLNGWSRTAILRWIDTNGETWRLADGDDRIDAAARALEAEYAA